MYKVVTSLWIALFLVSCGGGGGSASDNESPPVSGPTPAETLEAELAGLSLAEFYEVSHAALLYRSPETIVWQALTDIYPLDEVGLDDISADFRRDTHAMYEVALDALRNYDSAALRTLRGCRDGNRPK